jgi:glycosyltransferase involved in cell wall biosynthesis
MNILLVHQGFPGQFKHLAPALAANRAHRVVGFGMMRTPPRIPGVAMVAYRPERSTTAGIHPWVSDLETKVIRGHAAMKAARRLRDEQGFVPDVIFAHHGWGESMFLKEVWPRSPLIIYSEWYYLLRGSDADFDPEFGAPAEERQCRLRVKNAHNLLAMEAADAGVAPTRWQRDTHPAWFRERIEVIHDGIDCAALSAPPQIQPLRLTLPADADCRLTAGEVVLRPGDEIVTFVNRNLEPYRGYHIFMRALPELLRQRPRAQVVIVGGNGTSYGAKPAQGTWKQRFLDEVRGDLDLSRVHFVGNLDHPQFLHLLRLATVHTYLTYPFVLSWSLLEAMACGCAIVASDTAPVREAISEGETGRLVDFFSVSALTARLCELLDDPVQRARLGAAARAQVVEHYDLRTRCLPRQIALLERLAGRV